MQTLSKKKQHNNFVQRKNITPIIPHPVGTNLHDQRAQVRQIINTPMPQAKLTIGAPNDKYEQEADRVADAVMRMPESQVQREERIDEDEQEKIQTKPLTNKSEPQIQRLCPGCEDELKRQPEEGQDDELLQAKAQTGSTPEVSPENASGIRSLQGSGRPLPDTDRVFFEPRFDRDFSGVRIHTDSKAAQLANNVNARAFTLGRDVVFGAGQYQPHGDGGKRLMAHELVHVVQQVGGYPAVNMVQNQSLGVSKTRIISLHGVKVQIDNTCDVPQFGYSFVKNAAREMLVKVFNTHCIRQPARRGFRRNLRQHGIRIGCDGIKRCGYAAGYSTPANYLTLGTQSFPHHIEHVSFCDPMSSTLLHELIHLARGVLHTLDSSGNVIYSRDRAYGCEKACFGVGSGDSKYCS